MLCPCSNIIDRYGDHLLGCSHGPYRIRRHDSLRDIVYHALKVDNQNVKIEQSTGGPSNTRPGDVYHPDFDNGKPAFFDVSICNTLQPGKISTAAVSAGAIAEQGEMSKDSKHLQSVEAVGGSFYPLVVETMGPWTPFALRTIATRASLRSGLSEKQALKNLLQQLSIKLWSYNSKLVLNRLAIIPDPVDVGT